MVSVRRASVNSIEAFLASPMGQPGVSSSGAQGLVPMEPVASMASTVSTARTPKPAVAVAFTSTDATPKILMKNIGTSLRPFTSIWRSRGDQQDRGAHGEDLPRLSEGCLCPTPRHLRLLLP